ncbi:hypothetical protein LTR70_007025 [Exophiala xenobiotica]|uniref:RING-type domain-containing protein n=1 Tax=Lithohypha guttulata TaxID=1690604 RepID=A0ABR0K4Q2_9EURO|nr:hypothetical protein LTR24_006858 [Lithohypha guttulata]KAK5314726.1 hypothetical protein LTR70_007025 [Exophiala xenobiotica]
MAQQAPLEPGSALYELATSVDLSKVPEKLVCKNCSHFLLNAFKTACCDGALCENCMASPPLAACVSETDHRTGNTAAAGGACPLCKHEPLLSNASKALRGTARNYLKSALASAEKSTEPTPSLPPTESRENAPGQAPETPAQNGTNGTHAPEEQSQEKVETTQAVEESLEPSAEVVQSIEEPEKTSRRATMDSASGNEPDDEDIEINVGPDYDLSQVPDPKQTTFEDENQWPQDQHFFHEQSRKNSTKPQKQEQPQNNSFNFDNNMPSEAQQNQMQQYMQNNGLDSSAMPNMSTLTALTSHLYQFYSNPPASVNANPMFAQMQMNFQQMMQMNPMMANMMGPVMQNMGMPMPMGFNGNQNWGGNIMPFGNQNFNPIMNNGASYNQGQYNQNNFANGNFRNDRQGSFTRGRGGRKARGRGGFWQQQDQYHQNNNNFTNYNSNMPYQSQYGQASMNYPQNQYDNQTQESYPTNNDKENDQHADDDDFAPGGQDEVQEALGDSYNKKQSEPPEEAKVESITAAEVKREDYQEEPSTADAEQQPVVESPKQEPQEPQEPKEVYIPEAYREDLDFTSSVPPSAPSGPSAKDVPYRARGHGRFPSRGRGSFQGTNGYPPRSPARPTSQHQNVSPSTNQTPGVVGAPTGPRAMREKDAPPVRILSRAESDVGFKIRGTATKSKEETARSATPRSTYDDYDDRDRDSSRHQSKYDKKESSRHSANKDPADGYDYDADRDRRRRKSRREDDYDHDHEMQDAEHSHSRSDSQDRDSSRRNGHSRRDKDKARDKYSSSSKHKSSSRKYEGEDDHYNDTIDYNEERSKTSKRSSKHDDRDERRDRDYERTEKDKHRKRSRHDRDRDDGYDDADEEESRRRSRKHKKEHTSSSRKDRDRDHERERDRDRDRDETDIGMRITGRSHTSSHRTSEVATPTQPAADKNKDSHMLEREARNKERLLKELQRRENATKGSTLSGGRQKIVKYEDELESAGRLKSDGYSKSRHRR